MNSDQQLAQEATRTELLRAALTPDEKHNVNVSSNDLDRIFKLRSNPDFRWFIKECVIEQIKEARVKLLTGSEVELPKYRALYVKLVEIHDWTINREILHREAMNPDDPAVKALRESLYDANKS